MTLKVKLINWSKESEKIVASAAKLCYSPVGIDELMESQNEESIDSFLNMLIDLGHESPIEHVSYTFAIEGVSRSLTHQLVRHRIASYSQQSQRYVKLDQFEYIVPPNIEANEKSKKIYIEAMESIQKKYNEIYELLYQDNYKKEIEKNVPRERAERISEKRSIEDARYIFPNGCETKIITTMNARSLLNFFKHRCCLRAQWEIRDLATEMLKLVKEVSPMLFRKAGPGCISGPCPEGKMTCGEIKNVREFYKKL